MTGGGYLTVTVTADALAGWLSGSPRPGPACARSDALRGMSLRAPLDADLITAPTWAQAHRRFAAAVSGRLARAAGAQVRTDQDSERMTSPSLTAAGSFRPGGTGYRVRWRRCHLLRAGPGSGRRGGGDRRGAIRSASAGKPVLCGQLRAGGCVGDHAPGGRSRPQPGESRPDSSRGCWQTRQSSRCSASSPGCQNGSPGPLAAVSPARSPGISRNSPGCISTCGKAARRCRAARRAVHRRRGQMPLRPGRGCGLRTPRGRRSGAGLGLLGLCARNSQPVR